MKCPHGDHELKMAPRVLWNVEHYNENALGATECCGHGVTVQPIRSLRITKYVGPKTEDDWGADFIANPFTP